MKKWFVVFAVVLIGFGLLASPALSAGEGGCGFKGSKTVKDVVKMEKPAAKTG